eukprot:UN19623
MVAETYNDQDEKEDNLEFILDLFRLFPFAMQKEPDYIIYWSGMTAKRLCEIELARSGGLKNVVCEFGRTFRHVCPKLVGYFEQCELYTNEWALEWLKHFFLGNLQIEDLCRLWDTYFT